MKKKIMEILKGGGVGVLPTDTIYGLVGQALNKKTVERIYRLKRRKPDKPLIILIGELADLDKFGVKIEKKTKEFLKKYWPGAVSVILPCKKKEFVYLHRWTQTLAFRLPSKSSLRKLLKETGPLVAPSANPEGLPPARTIKEAKEYFGKEIDFYWGKGEAEGLPSTLVKIEEGELEILRKGAVKIK